MVSKLGFLFFYLSVTFVVCNTETGDHPSKVSNKLFHIHLDVGLIPGEEQILQSDLKKVSSDCQHEPFVDTEITENVLKGVNLPVSANNEEILKEESVPLQENKLSNKRNECSCEHIPINIEKVEAGIRIDQHKTHGPHLKNHVISKVLKGRKLKTDYMKDKLKQKMKTLGEKMKITDGKKKTVITRNLSQGKRTNETKPGYEHQHSYDQKQSYDDYTVMTLDIPQKVIPEQTQPGDKNITSSEQQEPNHAQTVTTSQNDNQIATSPIMETQPKHYHFKLPESEKQKQVQPRMIYNVTDTNAEAPQVLDDASYVLSKLDEHKPMNTEQDIPHQVEGTHNSTQNAYLLVQGKHDVKVVTDDIKWESPVPRKKIPKFEEFNATSIRQYEPGTHNKTLDTKNAPGGTDSKLINLLVQVQHQHEIIKFLKSQEPTVEIPLSHSGLDIYVTPPQTQHKHKPDSPGQHSPKYTRHNISTNVEMPVLNTSSLNVVQNHKDFPPETHLMHFENTTSNVKNALRNDNHILSKLQQAVHKDTPTVLTIPELITDKLSHHKEHHPDSNKEKIDTFSDVHLKKGNLTAPKYRNLLITFSKRKDPAQNDIKIVENGKSMEIDKSMIPKNLNLNSLFHDSEVKDKSATHKDPISRYTQINITSLPHVAQNNSVYNAYNAYNTQNIRYNPERQDDYKVSLNDYAVYPEEENKTGQVSRKNSVYNAYNAYNNQNITYNPKRQDNHQASVTDYKLAQENKISKVVNKLKPILLNGLITRTVANNTNIKGTSSIYRVDNGWKDVTDVRTLLFGEGSFPKQRYNIKVAKFNFAGDKHGFHSSKLKANLSVALLGNDTIKENQQIFRAHNVGINSINLRGSGVGVRQEETSERNGTSGISD